MKNTSTLDFNQYQLDRLTVGFKFQHRFLDVGWLPLPGELFEVRCEGVKKDIFVRNLITVPSRLREIRENEAQAEGLWSYADQARGMVRLWWSGLGPIDHKAVHENGLGHTCPRQAFFDLWDEVYKRTPGTRVADNPDILVMTFERVGRWNASRMINGQPFQQGACV